MKIERHSDFSVLVTFPSCRLASEFQQKIAARPDMPRVRTWINEWTDEDALIEFIRLSFRSGNDIPVDRITLTRAQVNEIEPELMK